MTGSASSSVGRRACRGHRRKARKISISISGSGTRIGMSSATGWPPLSQGRCRRRLCRPAAGRRLLHRSRRRHNDARSIQHATLKTVFTPAAECSTATTATAGRPLAFGATEGQHPAERRCRLVPRRGAPAPAFIKVVVDEVDPGLDIHVGSGTPRRGPAAGMARRVRAASPRPSSRSPRPGLIGSK